MSTKKYIIGITGTPGSGKSTFAKLLAVAINAELLEINDIAIKKKLFSSIDNDGTYVLKIKSIDRYLKGYLKRLDQPIIIVGHILPELTIDFDMIFVMRASLNILMRRLQKRNYSKNKLRENIIAEAFDYCNYNILNRDCPIIELENDKDKKQVIKALQSNNLKGIKKEKVQRDRSKELLKLIKENKWLGL